DPFNDVLDDDPDEGNPRGNQDMYWSEKDRQVIGPCQGLTKAAAACLRKLTAAVKANGDSALSDADVFLFSVDDLALCLYPPMDYSGVENNREPSTTTYRKQKSIIFIPGVKYRMTAFHWKLITISESGDILSLYRKQITKTFKEVDLHCKTHNDHHTSEISVNQLIVRRGQSFNITLKMAKPFNSDFDQLTMKAVTGKYPSEEQGTMSCFGVPDRVEHLSSTKAVWKAELQKNGHPETRDLALLITPPTDAPKGEYKLSARLLAEEKEIKALSVLFNPWCSDDWVFMLNEAERM
ncbi:hypothetical protein XENORESO_005926, partial [Xenotaenia resolanae]